MARWAVFGDVGLVLASSRLGSGLLDDWLKTDEDFLLRLWKDRGGATPLRGGGPGALRLRVLSRAAETPHR